MNHNMKYTFLALLIGVSCFATVHAESTLDTVSAFRSMKMIAPVSVVVPTVVEVPVDISTQERGTYALYDATQEQFLPYSVHDVYTQMPVKQIVTSQGFEGGIESAELLTDKNKGTSIQYDADEHSVLTSVTFTIVTEKPIESSSFKFELDRYVELPMTVSISARGVGDDTQHVVLAEKSLDDTVVFFPKTRAGLWVVTFRYIQPLRISELALVEDSVAMSMKRGIRFLAQPNAEYVLYHDADRYVEVTTPESGNLVRDTGVLLLPSMPSVLNPAYNPLFVAQVDTDSDSIPDSLDNCPKQSNPTQEDIDGNGMGDVCDDFDRDGRTQAEDNCPNIPNSRQADTDGDGIGDVCDGEESRFTEKHAWIPWVGMGVAFTVLMILFVLVAITPKRGEVQTEEESVG
jgi:hypothetical protein